MLLKVAKVQVQIHIIEQGRGPEQAQHSLQAAKARHIASTFPQ